MDEIKMLEQLREKELEYCNSLEVGCENYVKSMARVANLNQQILEAKKTCAEMDLKTNEYQSDKKRRKQESIREWTKIGVNVALPCIGLVAITAAEKSISYTGALRDITKSFVFKKM